MATPAKKQTAKPDAKKKDALATTDKNVAMSKVDIEDMLLADQGLGTEGIGAKDLAIPRISIIQSGSPQVKKSEGGYIKGAEEGDFYDNVANAVFAKGEEGFLFIPVSYRRANLEWKPDRGGFAGDHGSDDAILKQTTKDDKGRQVLKNGNEIVTTAEYYCIVMNNDGTQPRNVVISLAKTQGKHSRKLNSVISSLRVENPKFPGSQAHMFNPAMFYSVFQVTSAPESNDKGNWMGWSFIRKCDTLEMEGGEQLYLQARNFHQAVGSGKVTVSAPHVDAGAAGDGGFPEDGATL